MDNYSKKENLNKITEDIRIIQNLFTFLTGRSRVIELNGFDKEYEEVNLIIPMVSNEVINRSQYPSAIQLTNSNKILISPLKPTLLYSIFTA